MKIFFRFQLIFVAAIFPFSQIKAQAPKRISYQAVIRDGNNALLANASIGIQISILQESSIVYSERHLPTSNDNGLVTIDIGAGLVITGSLSTVDWAHGTYFIKVEVDLTGGINYTLSNTQQLLSVPFALYAEKSGSSEPGPPGSNGRTILNGTSNPVTEGVEGDFYINTSTNKIFGPKTNNNWGAGISLVGPQGAASGGVTAVSVETANGFGGIVKNALTAPAITLNTSVSGILKGDGAAISAATAVDFPILNQSTTGNAATVTTNADLTGPVTSKGNATAIANGAITNAMLANGAVTNLSGTNTGDQTITLTGDVTGTGSGTFATTLRSVNVDVGTFNAVTVNAKGLVTAASNVASEAPLTFSTGLARNANTITNNVNTGITGGQSIFGGTLAGETLALSSTLNAAKGKILFGSSAYDEANNRLGLGITTPLATLDVNGTVKLADGTQGTGKVLTSDAAGVATWQSPTGSGWGLNGNSGTVDGTNFIGTVDNIPFNLKVNNQKAGKIDPTLLNTFYGYQSGNTITTGSGNTAYGNAALFSNTTGSSNIAIGSNSLYSNNSGISNISIGNHALYSNTTGFQNIAIGGDALDSNTSGEGNVAIGPEALTYNTIGSFNTAVGLNALYNNTTGKENVASGFSSLFYNTTGNDNTASGIGSLQGNTVGSYNTANGIKSLGLNISGSQNTAYGGFVLLNNKAGSNATAIGYGAMANANDQVTAFSNTNVAVGYFSLHGSVTPSINTGLDNTAVGYQTLMSNTSGQQNTADGFSALSSNTAGSTNTANGYQALQSNTIGINNTAFGGNTLKINTIGNNNTASGTGALSTNTTGNGNTAIGYNSLISNNAGSQNTSLGFQADVGSGSLINATAIGFNAVATTSNSIQLGNSNVTRVLAGTGINATLIAGGLQITGGTPALGKVLTSDATGLATWQTVGAWGLTGNSGSLDGTSFIGTTDNVPFNIRVNNQKAGRIDPSIRNSFYGYQAGNSNINTGFNVGAGNTGVGYNSLLNNTSGVKNTAVGDFSMMMNTTGNWNVATGELSLANNLTGVMNTAVGNSSLSFNTTGVSNTAIGSLSLGGNIAGNENTALGVASLNYNKYGNYATAIGAEAMRYANDQSTSFNNTNVAVGFQCLMGSTTPSANTGLDNTAVGYQALTSNTSGWQNVANGNRALYFNTTGSQNTAIGNEALYTNTTGTSNTAIGDRALSSNTTGSYNSANGWAALVSNTTGIGNVANGQGSMSGNTTGSQNTANGNGSLSSNTSGNNNTADGARALAYNATGNNNTSIGYNSMANNLAGSNNTALGYQAFFNGDFSNSTAVGANAKITASNNMVFGDANVVGWGFGVSPIFGTDAIRVGIDGTNGNGATLSLGGTWTNASDKNKKENFSKLIGTELLSKIEKLPITRWNYKGESSAITHIGPMAQDFYKLFNVGNDDKSISTIDPSGIALAGIQELIRQIEEMRKQMDDLTKENSDLKLQMAAFKLHENRLQRLEQLLTSKVNAQLQTQDTK